MFANEVYEINARKKNRKPNRLIHLDPNYHGLMVTYPRLKDTPREMLDRFKKMQIFAFVSYWIICQEDHKTTVPGSVSTHIHAFFCFTVPFFNNETQTYRWNTDVWNFPGLYPDKVHHPNVRPKTFGAGRSYCRKSKDYKRIIEQDYDTYIASQITEKGVSLEELLFAGKIAPRSYRRYYCAFLLFHIPYSPTTVELNVVLDSNLQSIPSPTHRSSSFVRDTNSSLYWNGYRGQSDVYLLFPVPLTPEAESEVLLFARRTLQYTRLPVKGGSTIASWNRLTLWFHVSPRQDLLDKLRCRGANITVCRPEDSLTLKTASPELVNLLFPL